VLNDSSRALSLASLIEIWFDQAERRAGFL
jgi:hypothetical protein